MPVCLSLDIFPLYVTLKMGTCSWMEATSITYLVKCPIVLLHCKIEMPIAKLQFIIGITYFTCLHTPIEPYIL